MEKFIKAFQLHDRVEELSALVHVENTKENQKLYVDAYAEYVRELFALGITQFGLRTLYAAHKETTA